MTTSRKPHALTVAALLAVAPAWAHERPQQLAELADLSLEQLAQVTVTSAARREQPVLEAAASIFVITAEDIRRSGATSLPEVLRLAPNLQVMRGDTSQYVISARGGLTTTANKMLVLIDGRTIYTPLFSGVFYDAVAPLLEDIERIEVISGPGGTLWGTNAVNGVINVITRSTRATRGALLAAGAGNGEAGLSVRHGWQAGPDTTARIYARYFDRDSHSLQAGGSAKDDAQRWTAGFAAESGSGPVSLTFQGEAFGADVNNLGGPRDLSGGHLLGRWRSALANGASATVQGYYDHTDRLHAGTFDEVRDTVDLEGQYLGATGGPHLLALGAGYRASRDRTVPTAALGFMPPGRTLEIVSLYAQDEMRMFQNVTATAGLRAERNTYTGWEWLPNLRLAYRAGPDHVVWGAISRAVRSPSRIDADLVVPGFPPFAVINNPSFESEVAKVAEVGYRGKFGAAASVSLTAFHHRYERLRTAEPIVGGLTLANGAEGKLSGIEGWGDLRPTEAWRLIWGFTYMDPSTTLSPGRVNVADDPLGNNPKRTASLRSLLNVGPSVQLDLFARYVGSLPSPAIPSYTQLAARVGWRVSDQLDLSVTASNMLDPHVEFGGSGVRAIFERSYFAKVTWSY
jgi:iron complex outermembrane receptor protein